MSRHEVLSEDGSRKWVFGWDQPLMSFFLQVHHLDAPEDEQVRHRFGTADSQMYEVEDLVTKAREHGLEIPYATRVQLYGEKDDGR